MELKHMNQWDKAKRKRILNYIGLGVLVLTAIFAFVHGGWTTGLFILSIVVANLWFGRNRERRNHTHET